MSTPTGMPSITRHVPPTITRSARCAPQSTRAAMRIARARKAQFVQREHREIGLLAHRDLADVAAAEAARRALGGPAQRIEMGDRGVIGQAVDHQRVADAFHEVRGIVRRRAVDAQPHGRARRLQFARAALARGQHHVGGRAMADAHAMLAQPRHVAIREMDAMRQPGAGVEPAHILEIVERAHAEHRAAEGILVLGFGQMRVQAAVMLLRQFAAGAHQGLGDGEGRTGRQRHLDHRARRRARDTCR